MRKEGGKFRGGGAVVERGWSEGEEVLVMEMSSIFDDLGRLVCWAVVVDGLCG